MCTFLCEYYFDIIINYSFIFMIKILQLYNNTYIANLWMKDSYFCSMTFILTQPETSIQLIPWRRGVHKITSKSLENQGNFLHRNIWYQTHISLIWYDQFENINSITWKLLSIPYLEFGITHFSFLLVSICITHIILYTPWQILNIPHKLSPYQIRLFLVINDFPLVGCACVIQFYPTPGCENQGIWAVVSKAVDTTGPNLHIGYNTLICITVARERTCSWHSCHIWWL